MAGGGGGGGDGNPPCPKRQKKPGLKGHRATDKLTYCNGNFLILGREQSAWSCGTDHATRAPCFPALCWQAEVIHEEWTRLQHWLINILINSSQSASLQCVKLFFNKLKCPEYRQPIILVNKFNNFSFFKFSLFTNRNISILKWTWRSTQITVHLILFSPLFAKLYLKFN